MVIFDDASLYIIGKNPAEHKETDFIGFALKIYLMTGCLNALFLKKHQMLESSTACFNPYLDWEVAQCYKVTKQLIQETNETIKYFVEIVKQTNSLPKNQESNMLNLLKNKEPNYEKMALAIETSYVNNVLLETASITVNNAINLIISYDAAYSELICHYLFFQKRKELDKLVHSGSAREYSQSTLELETSISYAMSLIDGPNLGLVVEVSPVCTTVRDRLQRRKHFLIGQKNILEKQIADYYMKISTNLSISASIIMCTSYLHEKLLDKLSQNINLRQEDMKRSYQTDEKFLDEIFCDFKETILKKTHYGTNLIMDNAEHLIGEIKNYLKRRQFPEFIMMDVTRYLEARANKYFEEKKCEERISEKKEIHKSFCTAPHMQIYDNLPASLKALESMEAKLTYINNALDNEQSGMQLQSTSSQPVFYKNHCARPL